MSTEVSKIEEIIKGELEDETKKSVAMLVARMTEETQQAIDRINSVYSSAINTLKKLELTDATIFDFFQKTNGNIRVYEVKVECGGYMGISMPCGRVINDNRSIELKEKKYKIILMAIEVKE